MEQHRSSAFPYALNKVRLEFAMTGFAEATEAQEESTFYLRCFLVSNDSNRVECSWHFQSTMSRPFFWLIAIIIKRKTSSGYTTDVQIHITYQKDWEKGQAMLTPCFCKRRCAPDFKKRSSLDRSFFFLWHVETRRNRLFTPKRQKRQEKNGRRRDVNSQGLKPWQQNKKRKTRSFPKNLKKFSG